MDKGKIPEHLRKRILEAKYELDLSSDWSTDEKKKLTTIPEEIFEFENLISLNLAGNKISSVPRKIISLNNLKKLDLSNNQISNLPENFGNLAKLSNLNLARNNLSVLPESFSKLTNLEILNLANNQLSYLPETLGNLTKLKTLNVSNSPLFGSSPTKYNSLDSLPDSLGDLNNLETLNLANTKLSLLPEKIGNLINLKKLILDNNFLSSLPESIVKLTNLTRLYLKNNQLSLLPEKIGGLNSYTKVYLDNNPLIEPPIEIANQGIEAIRNYFRQLEEEGLGYIYEAKLLIVGEPGAGKTTLAKKIDNADYELKEREKSTEGIDVIQWSFPILDVEQKQRDFQVNIWDFGGQEIYHATHQFFLTKRSLYALVADTRKEDTDFYYWLNVVGLLSDNSPLLIIKNEKQDRKREINETALRGQFTNLEKTLATNLATNRGLQEILTDIKHYIQKLPHVGEKLPKTWVKVRQTLEQDERNYISLQDYLSICETNGFTQLVDKLRLSSYLHDLGVCLHFQDEEDSLLYKTVILKPEWGIEAVYKLMDNEHVINNKGNFTRKDLKKIWHEYKYTSMRGELLELMKKFQLCYEIPDNKNSFIAPQLLIDNQPEYDWDKSNNLILRYAYPDFMPKGIITRFIVVMHQYIDQQKYVWKSGVILNKDNTKAEVIEYYGKREIQIRVAGNNKRDLMTIVAHEINKISDSYNRLKYSKLIPCNCEICQNSQYPHFYSYETLKKFINNRQRDIQCQNSFKMIDVRGLIDDVIIWNKGNLVEKQKKHSPDQSPSVVSLTINNPQQGNNNTMSKITQSHSGSGDNIAGDKNTSNIYNSQDLTQAAADIQALLEQLEKTYSTNTTMGKMELATQAIQQIDNDPKLTSRILCAFKAGGISALDSLLDHPAASFVIGALDDWQQTKQ